jgi:hypothetical protein
VIVLNSVTVPEIVAWMYIVPAQDGLVSQTGSTGPEPLTFGIVLKMV